MPTEIVDVAHVWAGHRVGFALLTHGQDQYVGYYDEHRRMTFAQRKLGQTAWKRVTPHILDDRKADADGRTATHVGWDSHNWIVMAVDPAGHLHASGNMHVHPLVYFRATRPDDVMSLEYFPHMVGDHEKHVTYPRFFTGPDGALLFSYRDGSSGRGRDIYNRYDVTSQRWSRLLDQPLTDGQGVMNAYPDGPLQGPDGWWHFAWVWRDTPDAAANHDLCYARSRDLLKWEDSAGKPIATPIVFGQGETVDPVPAGGGMLNGNVRIGFDGQKRVVISYHKHTPEGPTQLFNARRERRGWMIRQASDWTYRWNFHGGGSLKNDIALSPVSPSPDGRLVQTYAHAKHGIGGWYLDEKTLQPVGEYQPPPPLPAELMRVESSVPGMEVATHRAGDYALRWEALPPHRDKPRPGDPPPPSMLRVVKVG